MCSKFLIVVAAVFIGCINFVRRYGRRVHLVTAEPVRSANSKVRGVYRDVLTGALNGESRC